MNQFLSTSKTELHPNITTEIRNGVLYTKYQEGSNLKGTPIIDFSKIPQREPTVDDFFELYANGVISEDILNRAILEL